MLVRSAFSANIKERRDCSTALFAEDGRMIAQAEHIPVHLGAMPEAVAAVRARDPQPGEVFVVNDPFTGGTHLPDITLVSRDRASASRSRGRTTRTSAAPSRRACRPARPTSTRRASSSRRSGSTTRSLTILLANMRNPDERRGDLRAQLAAHRLAERRLAELVRAARPRPGRGGDGRALRVLGAARARGDRRAPGRPLRGGRRPRGARGRARRPRRRHDRRRRDRDRLRRHGSPQHDGNLNCPLAVTRSACYFVVRCLTDPDVPASGGAFAPGHASARRRARSSTPARPPPSSPGTSRRRAGSSTSSSARSARRSRCPRRGRGR